MSVRNLCYTIILATVCHVLPISHSSTAFAENPNGVVRTFAIESLSPIDLQSDDSIGLIVAPPSSTSADVVHFHHTNSDPRFDSTVWQLQQVMHVTTGNADTPGAFMWLLDDETPTPPPAGAVTFNGHSPFQILSQEVFMIKDCDDGSCGFYNYVPGDKVISTNPSDARFTVITAVFSH